MNIVDKYIVSNKTRDALGFTSVAAITASVIGLIFSVFLNWKGYQFSDFFIPIIVGLFMGFNYFLYYLIIQKEDVSNLTGITYLYPIIVAILSFLFLNEILPLISYMGIALILIGTMIITLRMKYLKFSVSIWMLIVTIITVAINEFLIKIYTNNLPELNGIAVNTVFICVPALLGIIVSKKLRKSFISEIHNIRWAFFSEFLTFAGIFTLYFAMRDLSATIVSSIAAIQPLILLGFERVADKKYGNITKDKLILPKLIGIILIVVGVILLYLNEILGAIT
jgi:uncharacterized membrane protein